MTFAISIFLCKRIAFVKNFLGLWSSGLFRIVSEAQVSLPEAQAWVDMYSLSQSQYLIPSWVATAICAPVLESLVFGSSVPLELDDGRCGSLGSPPSRPLPFSLDGTRPYVLDCQRFCHRHLCISCLHCPAGHFSPRTVTYPQYAASRFACNDFTKPGKAAVAIFFARLLYLNLGNGQECSSLAGLHGGMCGRDLGTIFLQGYVKGEESVRNEVSLLRFMALAQS